MEAPLLLHSLLGHPSLSKFRKMVPHFSSLSLLECESCQLGKHTRVLFPKRLDLGTKSSFELVHTDVWGPFRSTSTLGFRYFVTFIDDYSRCTWLFLMKTRVELFSIFQKFHAKIHTQFNTSIRILRSDNAKEYFSMSFSSFMSSHGILHQSSCAYTPQHIGVVERKNRHLVETARTLLLHHKVPHRFWGDAILAACYLINRMPASILHDQIPHSILLPTQPLVYLPPRVFGCVCFVHILTPGQDKLSAKATKCVFLGYSRYFIFADVTFFEDSSFFSFLVLPSPDFPSPPPDVVTRPLQVYTRRPRPRPPTGPRVAHLLCRSHLLLRFRNRLRIYLLPFGKVPALLLTHILLIIFLAFIVYLYPTLPLFPPCFLSLPLKALVRLSLIRAGNRQWLRKSMLFTPMTHGNLSLFLLTSFLLVVVGFIQ